MRRRLSYSRGRGSPLAGLVAGAAGTVALNVVTYADMVEESANHRQQGLGSRLGYVTGLGVGVGYGLLRSSLRVPLPVAAVGAAATAYDFTRR